MICFKLMVYELQRVLDTDLWLGIISNNFYSQRLTLVSMQGGIGLLLMSLIFKVMTLQFRNFFVYCWSDLIPNRKLNRLGNFHMTHCTTLISYLFSFRALRSRFLILFTFNYVKLELNPNESLIDNQYFLWQQTRQFLLLICWRKETWEMRFCSLTTE